MTGPDNNSIILRIKQGDTSCLEELVLAYKSYCINGLVNKTRCSAEDAEDLFIDAILELRDKILSGKLDHLLNAKSYIFGICYNMWLSEQRVKRKNMDGSLDIINYYQQYLKEDFLFSENEVDFKTQLIDITNQALETLDEKCRRVIKYFYLEKRNMEEIAKIMDFASADVAKTTKSRCFKKLVEKAKALEKI